MSNWKAAVFESDKRLAIPIMTHPGIEMIGKGIIDAVTDGEIQFRAIKAIQEKYSPEAATMIMDLTVEAEAFGSKIYLYADEIPNVADRLVSDEKSIEKLEIPPLNCSRLPQYLRAARLAVEGITDKPVFSECIGPFSLAGRLFGISEIMISLFTEPETIKLLLGKCSSFLDRYVREMKRVGTSGVIMAEPAAGLLSGEMCDEFSSAYIKKIVDDVQDPEFLFILHNCGNTGQVTQSMISTGAGGLHFGNKVNLSKVLNEVPESTLVFGNVDPVTVFKSGTPKHVFDTTTELLNETADHRNFIISSGCDVPPGSPVQNIVSFFNAVDSFNSRN